MRGRLIIISTYNYLVDRDEILPSVVTMRIAYGKSVTMSFDYCNVSVLNQTTRPSTILFLRDRPLTNGRRFKNHSMRQSRLDDLQILPTHDNVISWTVLLIGNYPPASIVAVLAPGQRGASPTKMCTYVRSTHLKPA